MSLPHWARMQCCRCGHFISKRDIDSGEAAIRMVSADSETTVERFECICKQCNKKKD